MPTRIGPPATSVKVFIKEQGHGGAVNAGLAATTSTLTCASRRLWTGAPRTLSSTCCVNARGPGATWTCSSPTTSDKQGKSVKAVIRRNVLPADIAFGLGRPAPCRYDHLMMHAPDVRTGSCGPRC